MQLNSMAAVFSAAALAAGSTVAAPPANERRGSPPSSRAPCAPRTTTVAIVPDAAALTFTGKVEDLHRGAAADGRGSRSTPSTWLFLDVRLTATGGTALAPPAVSRGRGRADGHLHLPSAARARRLPAGHRLRRQDRHARRSACSRSTTTRAKGKKRALFTQFENSDARRMHPLVGRAGLQGDLRPRGHRAQRRDGGQQHAGGRARRTSATGARACASRPSPKMSTYLLFFGAGRLRARHRRRRAKTRDRDRHAEGRSSRRRAFALESSATVLREYNDYFGMPYPLPKLDNIAAPGRSQFFGAMENWGAIFTFEYALLLDPAHLHRADSQSVFSVAAHEMAHQWFGDLVTMAWWDDLWLNEGFASWMAGRTTEQLHPEWNTALAAVGSRDERDGARCAGHHAPGGAAHRDRRAGQPGLRRHHLPEGRGGHPHARGLRRRGRLARRRAPLHRRRTPTATPSPTTCGARSKPRRSKPVIAIAHDFTLQPGVPLIAWRRPPAPGGTSRGRADPGRVQPGPAGQEAAGVAGAGDRAGAWGRRSRCARW